MTFTKEQISQAFIEVLNERVPDLSDIPDHVFSERFEKNMNKLIRREAAHPWAVSHTLARNLITAAIVIILLFSLCMSVGAIRNAIFKFFREHFEVHDDIVFEMPEKTRIEEDYVITALPAGFLLKEENLSEMNIMRIFENENGDIIHLSQNISMSNGISLDNERSGYDSLEIDGRGVFLTSTPEKVMLAWDQDGYVFFLVLQWKNVTVDDAIAVFRSIRPVD